MWVLLLPPVKAARWGLMASFRQRGCVTGPPLEVDEGERMLVVRPLRVIRSGATSRNAERSKAGTGVALGRRMDLGQVDRCALGSASA